MKTSEVLKQAKALIVNPENWMQGDYTNNEGCFCSLGAIAKVSLVDWMYAGNQPATKLLRQVVNTEMKAEGFSPDVNFAQYNDTRTHTEVMEAFDKAITLAQAQEVS